MLKFIRNGILILLAFIASFQLAYYLDDKKLYLPPFLNQLLGYFDNSNFAGTSPLDLASIDKKAVKSPALQYEHQELPQTQRNTVSCIDHSLGNVKVKPQSKIYTWKDKSGVTNFSDSKPEDTDSQSLTIAGPKIFDYFKLNISGANVPFEFKEKLTHSINKLFALYGQLIAKEDLRQVVVNLRFFTSKQRFLAYSKKHAPSLNPTAGFYDNGTNEAVIMYYSSEQAITSAIHESVHAINRGIIGNSNKWFNEGMAEYLENITINLSSAIITRNKSWYENGKLKYRPLPLRKVLSASRKEWNSQSQSNLYSTSWAFIYFLMDDTKRKAKLVKMLKAEQQNLCNTLSFKQTMKIFNMSDRELQNRFSRWLAKGDKFTHQI
ncbi:DUF4124 domain-containing protein [Paraglaciecola arctica]|uniref:DUF4124 domain-containing protein n=1 Tax=Paraglaciecola arctica BSs20135 TaxID=493475 RepID=K6Y1A3_9ALTE|nr:DUF4124 domain-containing protein [Paraglaciecola arctica]GAC17701.1 hypothetical protein GARC_0720 [Paraglaciecola arctica BSs20135]